MSSLLRRIRAYDHARHLAMLIGCLFIGCPTFAYANNDCDGILVGLVDFRTSTSEEQFSESILQWLASTKSQTETSTKNQSANAGFTIPGYLHDFTGKWERGEYQGKTYAEALNTHFNKNTETRKQFFDSFKQANPNVTNAWLECKKESYANGRLRCWAEPKFSDEAHVTIHYELRSNFGQPQEVTIINTAITPNFSPLGGDVKGRTIASDPNGVDVIFSRTNRNGGVIQIMTTHPTFNCTAKVAALPIIEPCCAPEPPKAPCIEVDAQGECTKCKITFANGISLPHYTAQTTPSSEYCPNMKSGNYRAKFTGTLRGDVPLMYGYPRVDINPGNRTTAPANFVELGLRQEPPAATQSTIQINDSTKKEKSLQPVNKQFSVMLYIGGPTHCRNAADQPAACYLDNGTVLIEPQ